MSGYNNVVAVLCSCVYVCCMLLVSGGRMCVCVGGGGRGRAAINFIECKLWI